MVIDWGPLQMSYPVFVSNFLLQVTANPLPTWIFLCTSAGTKKLESRPDGVGCLLEPREAPDSRDTVVCCGCGL